MLDRELLRRTIFNAAADAAQAFVDEYNATNDAEVDQDASNGQSIAIDGGGVHGALEVSIRIEDL